MNKIYSSNAFSLFLSSIQINQKISVFASSDDLQAEYVVPVGEPSIGSVMSRDADGTSTAVSFADSSTPAMSTGGGAGGY